MPRSFVGHRVFKLQITGLPTNRQFTQCINQMNPYTKITNIEISSLRYKITLILLGFHVCG